MVMIKKIVIVGGGSAGWMTAAWFSKTLQDINITLIESSDIPVIGVGESTLPAMVDFMKALGLEEKDWLPNCNGTYKSAISFKNFYRDGDPTMWYPFDPVPMIEGRPITRHWLHKFRHAPSFNDRYSFYDYCFIHPALCEAGKTVRSMPGTTYAYHVDAGLLGEVLKDYSKKGGIRHIVDTITTVNRAESGAIKSLSRKQGPDLEADLFIDCSGFRALLIGKNLEEPFDSYGENLLCDTAIALRYPYEDKAAEMSSYTRCTALKSGWVWRVPLYSRLGCGYVYSSAHTSAEEAEREFRQHLGEARVKDCEARHIPMRVGKQRRTWVKNCVAIGLSAGFVEPLESTGLFLWQGCFQLLASMLQDRRDYTAADVDVYNANITRVVEIVRDFLVCHYVLTEREDTPFWKDVKYATKVPEAVTEKLTTARLVLPDIEHINQFDKAGLAGFSFQDGWQCILAGMNYLPFENEVFKARQVSIYEKQVVDHIPKADAYAQKLQDHRSQLSQLPSHYEFLRNGIYKGTD